MADHFRCAYPVELAQGGHVRCGQCMYCRILRRREKVSRLFLEAHHWAQEGSGALFGTLTYQKAPLTAWKPPRRSQSVLRQLRSGKLQVPRPTLVPEDPQSWLKLVRRARPEKTPAAYVGEYGDRTARPHYHAILFNVGERDVELLQAKWSHGFTMWSPVTPERIGYICGYTTKKLTSKSSERNARELGPREPEFFRWSLNPAIGKVMVPRIVDWLERSPAMVDWIKRTGDVPHTWKMGKKSQPFDRSMRKWLRAEWSARNPEHPISDLAAERPAGAVLEPPSGWVLESYRQADYAHWKRGLARRKEAV